jgi:allantoate deiminase
MWRPKVDEGRLWRQINELGSIGSIGRNGGIIRPTWSPQYESARRWLIKLMDEAGLETEIDAVGNTWGRWRTGELPALVIGSHIDTVPNGGRFDGALGVLAGIEAVSSLRALGFKPKQQIWVVAWAEEEGSATGMGLLGSRAYTGLLSPEERAKLPALLIGGDHASPSSRLELDEYQSSPREIFAYLELHIEQGPILAKLGTRLGVVSQIVAVESGVFHLEGVANHAGGAPMEDRKDASAAGAQVILAARDCAIQAGIRATCGRIELIPNATNVIPRSARVFLDARALSEGELEIYLKNLHQRVLSISDASGVIIGYEQTYRLPAAIMDPQMQALIAASAKASGTSSTEIVSGAGHDAMALAARVPTGMIFVPSEAGISHAPGELTKDSDCAAGTLALMVAISELASSDPKGVWQDDRPDRVMSGVTLY